MDSEHIAMPSLHYKMSVLLIHMLDLKSHPDPGSKGNLNPY